MQDNQHDAAWPQELKMNQTFGIAEDGKVRIVGAVIRDNAQVN
ncbi:hypothetical protein [Pseudomonas sp. B21-059]|nr:hypothetical protein [Pseudomonas sp. B21-059]